MEQNHSTALIRKGILYLGHQVDFQGQFVLH